MTDKKAGADTNSFKMKPKPGSPPGLETDGKGRVIPLAQRTADDRAKAQASIKNPNEEAQHPAPMRPGQQGQGEKRPTDPAGQQGGQRK